MPQMSNGTTTPEYALMAELDALCQEYDEAMKAGGQEINALDDQLRAAKDKNSLLNNQRQRAQHLRKLASDVIRSAAYDRPTGSVRGDN